VASRREAVGGRGRWQQVRRCRGGAAGAGPAELEAAHSKVSTGVGSQASLGGGPVGKSSPCPMRAGAAEGASAGKPRCLRIRRAAGPSSMEEMTRREPPHAQASTSSMKTRRSRFSGTATGCSFAPLTPVDASGAGAAQERRQLGRRLGHDSGAPPGGAGEHAVVRDHVAAVLGNQAGEPLEQRHGREHERGGAVGLGRLQSIGEQLARALREAAVGDGAAQGVPAEALDGDALMGLHGGRGVQVPGQPLAARSRSLAPPPGRAGACARARAAR